MPIYSLQCPSCDQRDVMYRRIADRNSVPDCSCGATFQRTLDKPFVQVDIPAYISPGTGKLITSKTERREDLLHSKAYEWEPGMDRDIASRKQSEIQKAFEPISTAVDTIVRDLNTAGKLETQHA